MQKFAMFYFTVILVDKTVTHRTIDKEDMLIEDKVILKPAELINLLAKESKNKKRSKVKQIVWDGATTPPLLHVTRKETYNDDELMRLHKVWSRWGKWGGCSVTCGQGIISRSRFCVSGRCAPGELEEQHRPCYRGMCTRLADDVHDLDI